MAQGTDRREGTPDSLVGASEITPVLPQTPALQVPNASVPDVVNSPSAQMLRGIQQWSGKKLQEAANVKNEARILDGQMAYQQGKAMEDIDMDGNLFGDKWAMQGYRVMEAQTTASTMLAAQQEMIRQSQYEQDPEQFRATYINRLEQQLDGMDPQTAKMVREQMADHMPTLVAQQTTAYMQNEEQNAFDTLSASIDVMSKDATAFDALITNAIGGEGSPSAGLSPDRTRGAVVSGTIAAFNNGNPVAYHQLKASGLLDELPDAERQAIKAAKSSYETEVRNTFDEGYSQDLLNFERDLAAGDADIDDFIALQARYNRNITAAQGQAVMAGSKTAGDLGERADVIVLQTAQTNRDWGTVAELTQDIVMHFESGGNLDATGPVIEGGANTGDQAQGGMQVMPKTMDDPGFGIRPSNGSRADTLRVGREYWAAMVERYDGNIEAAAIGYNAGPGNADKWMEAGGDYSVLPDRAQTEPYAKGISESANGGDLYYTSAERFSMAQTELQSATQLRDAVLKQQGEQAQTDAEAGYNLSMVDVAADFKAGVTTRSEYMAAQDAALSTYDLDLTRSIANSRDGDITAGINAAAARAESARSAATSADTAAEADERKNSIALFKDDVAVARGVFRTIVNAEGVTGIEIRSAQEAYLASVREMGNNRGLVLADTGFAAIRNTASESVARATLASKKYEADQSTIDRALATGTVSALSPELQKRAFTQAGARVDTGIADLTSTGQIPAEQTGTATAQANMGVWVQAGTVPKQVADQSTAILGRKLVGPGGDPNPDMISTIQMWDQIRQDSPEVAATMLDEAGMLTAEAVLDFAGGSFSSTEDIGAAMLAMQNQIDGSASMVTGNRVDDAVRINSGIINAVNKYFKSEDIGYFQGLFSGNADISQRLDRLPSEEARVFADETAENLSDHIMQEAVRLQKIRPDLTPEYYAEAATRSILDRTSVVGGEVLVMDKGLDIQTQLFGEHADTMSKDGIEQEVILFGMQQLASEYPKKWGFLAEIAARENYGMVGRGTLAVADSIAGAFGGSVARPVISQDDALGAGKRGVRPFTITSNGQNVGIRVIQTNGLPSEFLPLGSLRMLGDDYRAEHQAGVLERAANRDFVPQFLGDVPPAVK
jgi:hypothetical protein